MQSAEKRKILILSLGTGNILGKDAREWTMEEKKAALLEKRFSYRSAEYLMEGGVSPIKTEFVAEPLMKAFQPDDVFIIGTSKSAWTGFYGKFGDGNDEIIQRLFQIEERGGKDLPVDKLKTLSGEVEQYYKEGISHEVFRQVNIHIIMLRYGLDEAELLENYRILSSIEAALDREHTYEAAFDITHSFRSLPLYNLVILNYLKNVTQINLEISHVYYGNVEITNENNGKAPIVDLQELIKVLDLSRGVSEFKNTGNAVSLLQCIPDTENDVKEALRRFDWATQINSYDKVVAALTELIEVTYNQRRNDSSDKFTDLREMIANVIQIKFFGESGMNQISALDFKNMPTAEKQFLLCKWYLNQNRYGQAVVTAMEALRSYLAPVYLQSRNIDLCDENLVKETYRRQAIGKFRQICSELLEGGGILTNVEILCCELSEAQRKATKIRNVFAHNLSENISESAGIDESEEYYHGKEMIEDFIEKLEKFRECLKQNRQEVEKLYQENLSKETGSC